MRNESIFIESQQYIPGGVNSPVRAFKAVNMFPPIIKKGKGAIITDEEGNKYIDFVGAWGPMILGHNDSDVVNAIKGTCEDAIAFGAPTHLELELAKLICTTVPNVEMVRMVNSGTEATMSAVKLARGYKGRDKIIKFAGCYHGHYDGFLVEAGSGVLTQNIPGSPGVPQDSIKNTLIASYNHIKSVKDLFEEHKGEIAAIIIEPIAGNMGVIPATQEFMTDLRALCTKEGALLIFDEVMTGFRVDYKGAQNIYDIKPDLITFAKIMGGGLPCGAFGGRREIMEYLSPVGPVYQAGTMSGNPIVMAAGLASLRKLYSNPGYYDYLEEIAAMLANGMQVIAKEKEIPLVINRQGSMMTMFFTDLSEVQTYDHVKTSDTERYARFFAHMINGGFYISPSQFEALFINVTHTKEHIESFLERVRTFQG
ncbi:MAG TPA: glutamate-1-semialdehyde 2,1-aminomutase [Epulopiscium sp.]|nr:glutamate-1-semialdehyde 2,1-aminomutase [Candidatus Epulonipiscium sp.]